MEEKLAHARDCQKRDGVNWTIAVDDVEGTLHRALDPKPHSAWLVDARGNVAGRILWANHIRHLERALEALARGEPVGDDESKAVPMLGGLGRIDEVLAESGGYARTDFAREVPPMFALARRARVFAAAASGARSRCAGDRCGHLRACCLRHPSPDQEAGMKAVVLDLLRDAWALEVAGQYRPFREVAGGASRSRTSYSGTRACRGWSSWGCPSMRRNTGSRTQPPTSTRSASSVCPRWVSRTSQQTRSLSWSRSCNAAATTMSVRR